MDGVRWSHVDPLQSFVTVFCVARLSGVGWPGQKVLRPYFPQSLGGPFPSRKAGRILFCRPVCGSTFLCRLAQSWYKPVANSQRFCSKNAKSALPAKFRENAVLGLSGCFTPGNGGYLTSDRFAIRLACALSGRFLPKGQKIGARF